MIWVILWPAFYLMYHKKIFSGIICLFMQFTGIGWIVAIFWANSVRKEAIKDKQHQELMSSLSKNDENQEA